MLSSTWCSRRTLGSFTSRRAAARLEEEERVRVERGDLEIVGILRRDLLHGVGVRAILLDALRRVELLDVADRDGVDERAFLRRGARRERARLLGRRIRVRRIFAGHRLVQVRAPRPRFAPIADRAFGVALPRFAKRPHRLGLGKRVHHLKALVEVRLRLLVGRRDRLRERPEAGLVDLDRLGVAVVARTWLLRRDCGRQHETDSRDRKDGVIRQTGGHGVRVIIRQSPGDTAESAENAETLDHGRHGFTDQIFGLVSDSKATGSLAEPGGERERGPRISTPQILARRVDPWAAFPLSALKAWLAAALSAFSAPSAVIDSVRAHLFRPQRQDRIDPARAIRRNQAGGRGHQCHRRSAMSNRCCQGRARMP